jgi:hypothetical protein
MVFEILTVESNLNFWHKSSLKLLPKHVQQIGRAQFLMVIF